MTFELQEIRAYSSDGRLGHEGGFGILAARLYAPAGSFTQPEWETVVTFDLDIATELGEYKHG